MSPIKQSDLIVVTGGAGFIGSNVAYALNRRGFTNILIVDDLSRKGSCKWENLVPLRYDMGYMHKDQFLQLLSMDKGSDRLDTLKRIKILIHLGADSSTKQEDAEYVMRNNLVYSQILCNWAIEHDVRFVYASSAATYGLGEHGFEDSNDISYLESLRPLNIYGYGKHLFDTWAARNGLLGKICGLKYFNVYGPNEYHKAERGMGSGPMWMYKSLKNQGHISLFKSYKPEEFVDGEQVRDFVYVKDAAAATVFAAIDRSLTMNGLYNVGTGNPVSWNELARHIIDTCSGGLTEETNYSKMIRYIDIPNLDSSSGQRFLKQYQYYTCANNEKLMIGAGFSSHGFTPIDQGVSTYINGYLARGGLHTGE